MSMKDKVWVWKATN